MGGFAAAFPSLIIVDAVDIDQSARDLYSANFRHPYSIKEIASIPMTWFSQKRAELWWMSPPCTPFTQRGAQRDLDDPRSDALKHLIHAVATMRPPIVCIENVVGFECSKTFDLLQRDWNRAGYHIQTISVCPSELGWPNRRPRVYCIASLEKISGPQRPVRRPKPLSLFLDNSITPESHPKLWIEKETIDRYFGAMDRVAMTDDNPITACFASSYGKTIVRSGSYLETEWGYRRFSPREVARLLGFDNDFRLPDSLSLERQWHLLGNSLSLPALRYALSALINMHFLPLP